MSKVGFEHASHPIFNISVVKFEKVNAYSITYF